MNDKSLAFGLTVLAFAAALAYFLLSPNSVGVLGRFTPEHVSLLKMYDNTPQQAAYRVLLLVLALGASVGAKLGRRGPLLAERRWGRPLLVLAIDAVVVAFLSFSELPSEAVVALQGGTYAMTFFPSVTVFAATVASALVFITICAALARNVPLRYVRVAVGVLIGAWLLLFFIDPLLRVPDFTRFNRALITGIEWHYSGVMGPADRLAAGLTLFEDVRVYSGFLPTIALALAQRVSGHLSFGAHIRLVEISQVVFAILALIAFSRWRPREPLYVLVGFLMIAPWISTVHAAVLYPNQSAWRALALPLGVLLLLHVRSRPPLQHSSLWLGMLAGAVALFNTEIGACVMLALLLSQLSRLRREQYRYAARYIANFVFGAVVAVGLCVVVFRLGLGYWPLPHSLTEVAILVQRFTSGYGGLPLEIVEPMAFIILFHAAYVFVRSVLRWRRNGNLAATSATELAIACTILLWGAYYAKAPYFWNLWTFIFLYAFLLAPAVRTAYLKSVTARPGRLSSDWRLHLLVAVVLPAVVFSNWATVRAANERFIHVGRIAVDVSGVRFSREVARDLQEKAAYLRQSVQQDAQLVFLTANSYIMPLLSGYYPPLPFQDAFAETMTVEDFDLLTSRVRHAKPSLILVDDPKSAFAGPMQQREFFSRFMNGLADSYVVRTTDSGWQVWQRKPR